MNKTYSNCTPHLIFTLAQAQAPIEPKYCLYTRKSSESEERQALSIDSQAKEMLEIATRDNINVIEIRRESHSAKNTG